MGWAVRQSGLKLAMALLALALLAGTAGAREMKPLIVAEPPKVQLMLPVDSQETVLLTISNNFPQLLTWTLSPVPPVTWLSADPVSGTIPASESQQVFLALDTAGLEPGNYATFLIIDSDDPETPQLEVPVTLAVVMEPGPEPAWIARYNGPDNRSDMAEALDVDAAGNVYVTGYSWPQAGPADYVTVKYDSQGKELWVAKYNGPGNHNDQAVAVAVDLSGNVYVTGYSWGAYQPTPPPPPPTPTPTPTPTPAAMDAAAGTGDDYATIKYDSNGNQLWVARYNGPGNSADRASALTVDTGGNVYVTGVSWSKASGYDYATIKYAPDGARLWVAKYNGPGNGSDQAFALAVDGAGNVYVTGYSWGQGTSYDYSTVKYDSQGNEQWVAKYNTADNDYDTPLDLAVDGAGNVYVTGYSTKKESHYDYATIKYDSQGNELWVARYAGPAKSSDIAHALAIDGEGNVFVAGQSCAWGDSCDFVTVKYDQYGNQVWMARYDSPDKGAELYPVLALDTAGNVYVTGASGLPWVFDYLTLKYDSEGKMVWVARYDGHSERDDVPEAVAVDAAGYVYVTGYSMGINSSWDYATIRYGGPVVVPPTPVAQTALKSTVDGDSCAGNATAILAIEDPETGNPLETLLGGYQATYTYPGNLLTVLEVRLKPPFGSGESNVNNAGGITSFLGWAPFGAPPPIDPLAFLTLRLIGAVTEETPATLTFTEIVDIDGHPIAQKEPLPQLTFKRGDAKADDIINIADVLFMGQNLAGLRGVGIGLDKVNPVNAASIKWDGACDKITIADLLILAQYLAGLRHPDLTPMAFGSPPGGR